MSGPADYRTVLRLPGALRAFLPSLTGRMSIATASLALLFAVEHGTGSFTAAGSALGLFGLANVLTSPLRARLVDRYGQRLTLPSMAALYAMSLAALVLLLGDGSQVGLVLGVSAAAGATPPPLGPSMRVLWSRLAEHHQGLLTRAYSLDAVADELLYTTGPLIVGLVIAATNPAAALVLTAALSVAGTVGMVTSGVSGRQLPRLAPRTRHNSPLRQPGFGGALVALLGVGAVLGAIEVAAPAFAQGHASVADPALSAGLLLAAFSGGSAVGGLLYGRRHWSWPPHRRLVLITGALVLTSALLIPASSLLLLAGGLAVVGFFLAPSLVTGYLLADALTTSEVQTEASNWINTAVNAGASLAAAAGGLMVDAFSPAAAFALGTGAAVLATLTAVVPATRSGQLWPARNSSSA
ncbi:MFS transporter [Arthrobacter castelli]|uniref:MFS transporter n=1 Tax=Arthrobacter castelli TaxID=271431 RepID=UPI000417176F|nr:MFS transporter [Arthrobacter castelli]